jgi:hypothetical protein
MEEVAIRACLFATCFLLISCLVYSSFQKMKVCSSETSVDLQWTIQLDIPEDRTLKRNIIFSRPGQGPNYSPIQQVTGLLSLGEIAAGTCR